MAIKYIRVRWRDDQRASEQEFTLDGVRVRLRCTYNASTDRWYASLQDTEGATLVSAVALVPGLDLFAAYKHLAIPQGRFFLEDVVTCCPASLESMDNTALLKYREA